MKKIVGIVIFASLVVGVIYGVIKIQANNESGQKVTKEFINEYLTLIKNEQYEEAYNKYWLEAAKKDMPFDKYKKTFEDRNKKLGKLKSWEGDEFSIESNIFTGEKVYKSDYFLYYERINYRLVVQFSIIEENDTAKIEMTYKYITSYFDKEIF